MKSPLAALKETFGDKAKLVAELEKLTKSDDLWVSRLNANKGLAHVSNAKLLRLHKTFATVKEKFGTRAKLIDAIAELQKRSKDDGYKVHLGAFPVPRLWDMYQSMTKRMADPAKATAANKGKAAAKAKQAARPEAAKVVAPVKSAAAKRSAAAKLKR